MEYKASGFPRTTMERCYNSRINSILRLSLLILGVFVLVLFASLGMAVILIYGIEDNLIAVFGMFMIIIGILTSHETLWQFRLLNRKYAMNNEGLLVQHSKRRTEFYPWDTVSQICICVIHKNKSEGYRDTVIWCTVGPIKHGPPDPKRCWSSQYYGMRYFNSVITMEYSPDRLDEFRKYYSGMIHDFR